MFSIHHDLGSIYSIIASEIPVFTNETPVPFHQRCSREFKNRVSQIRKKAISLKLSEENLFITAVHLRENEIKYFQTGENPPPISIVRVTISQSNPDKLKQILDEVINASCKVMHINNSSFIVDLSEDGTKAIIDVTFTNPKNPYRNSKLISSSETSIEA